ncbi:GspH/FimT family pseudopilin [Coralloluteibacterium stylophorae]|uniref:Type II secretion system protein H n=1 Tax=Coralloluteibacterium stylophorae TaxID=1776034 RepID=A0A8J7VYD6_9GAMM|nr:GspH/FimT family pseudopilin [Coralloluteibacterium stylophorae]
MPKARGFTLVELMITVAVLAVVAAIALPNFKGTMQRNQLATAANEVLAAVALARTEALRSPRTVSVCASDDGASCGGEWSNGWLVWIDEDASGGACDVGSGDRVLRYVETNRNLSIAAESESGGSAECFQFDRQGRVQDRGRRALTITVDDAPDDASLVREIRISATGQTRICQGACA